MGFFYESRDFCLSCKGVNSVKLPQVLIIDDLFGRPGIDRINLCYSYGLVDHNPDAESLGEIPDPVANVQFCTSQSGGDGVLHNDLSIALRAVEQGWPFADGSRWALVLLDLRFVSGSLIEGEPQGRPGDDEYGLKILCELRVRFPDLPVVILSSLDRKEVIEACRNQGAVDFIQRHSGPSGEKPRDVLRQKLHLYGLLEDDRGVILGRSLSLLKMLAEARRAASGGGNVLLYGESGTGKELLARYIHDNSPRADHSYVIFHPFGVAETLMEDELFGHEKGAFTGAGGMRKGLFEQANGGTLFIDEIGDIPVGLQNRLLRPIESRVVTRQGASEEISVDLKIVLATNKFLEHYAQSGTFKFDLLNRIRAYTIELPGLQQRLEDIPMIVQGLLQRLCHEHDARWPRQVDPQVIMKLQAYDWKEGNIRDLRNVLERAVKDTKDSELLLPGDLTLPSKLQEPSELQKADNKSNHEGSRIDRTSGLLHYDHLPTDYERLEGLWPELEKEIAELFAHVIMQSCRVTRRHRPGSGQAGEINLAGAVGCLLGKKVTTIKAADLVKRLLTFSPDWIEERLHQDPELAAIYSKALRSRPSRKLSAPLQARNKKLEKL